MNLPVGNSVSVRGVERSEMNNVINDLARYTMACGFVFGDICFSPQYHMLLQRV